MREPDSRVAEEREARKEMPSGKPEATAAPRRYFERPDADVRPLTLRETLVIVLATHLGVRTRARREEDFRRANGLHLFVAGVIYFLLLVGLLVLLATYLSGR